MSTPRAAALLLRVTAGLALAGAAVVVTAGPAMAADPVFSEGDCVIYRVTDGGPGGAQCAGVDLTQTRFGEGDFRNADLQGASFVDGDVQGAVFSGANLGGADFSGTRIVGADFSGSSILPAVQDLTADASGTAAVTIQPNLPAGLNLDGCSIVGTPISSGQTFPVGTSNILCQLSTSFSGTATLVMTVNVTASVTATPTQTPLFTPEPATATPLAAAPAEETPNWLMIGGFIGGGVLVVAGIVAFIVSNRRGHA